MTTENTPVRAPTLGAKMRPARELTVELVFRPLAWLVVLASLGLRVPPPALVLAHGVVGLAGAWAIARGDLVAAALLLQLKTVLDNADGALARVSGRVSLLGRYLDTVVDLAVNAAVFAALGHLTGEPWLAAAAFVTVTAILSVDFNLVEHCREAYGEPSDVPAATGSPAERILGVLYDALFTPQDRLVRAVSQRRLARLVAPVRDPARALAAGRAYHDRGTLVVLANLGLSTLLLVLGACLVLDAPVAFLWIAVAAGALLPALQLRRERLARRALER